MDIKFKKLVPEAQTPYRKYDVDAGFDLYATSIEKTVDYIEYKTGIAVEIPEGYVGLIFPRSSVTTYDLMLKNCVGVIDASYRGEIRCRFSPIVNGNIKDILIDVVNEKFNFKWNLDKQYKVGDRVAQIVFIELPKINLVEVQELSDTQRGTGGFGSTNKKHIGVIASSIDDFRKYMDSLNLYNTKFRGYIRRITTPNGDEYFCITKAHHLRGITLDDVFVTESGYSNNEINKIVETILPTFVNLTNEKMLEIKKKLKI